MKQGLILAFALLLFAQFGFAQQYNFKNYSVKNGIAQSQVYSILQDSRGYMWMGTYGGGINAFDGWNFKTLTQRDGLGSNYVYDVKEDSEMNLWIATKAGISKYDGQNFTNFSDGNRVRKMAFDAKQQLFLATDRGLAKFNDGNFINLLDGIEMKDKSVRTLCVKDENHIFFGTAKGFFQLVRSNGKYELIKYGDKHSVMTNAIASITPDNNGNYWIGTFGDGAYRFDGKTFSRIDYHRELYTQTVHGITIDSKGLIWFSTLTGVIQYNPVNEQFSKLNQEHGLANNHVRTVCEDVNGNYWIGTSGGGVSHYLGKQFTTYTKADGLGGNFIYSVFRDSKGSLWIGNSKNGVSILSGGKWTNFNESNGFENIKVKSIGEANGRIILGTERNGIYTYDGENFEMIPDFKRMLIRSVITDKNGIAWIATGGDGIFSLSWTNNKPNIKHFDRGNGLPDNWITALHCDKWNRIWYGTENTGIGQIAKGKLSLRIKEEDGLTSNTIRSFAEDQSGNLWIGTAGEGVCRVELYSKTRTVKTLSSKVELSSQNIYLLTIDDENNLIIGSEKGLDYLYLNENRVIKELIHFADEEGFAGVETCTNSVFNDKDGSIWFGTINGLNHYNGTQRVRNTQAPKVNLLDVKLYYESIRENEDFDSNESWNDWSSIELSYDDNHITFEFLGINQIAPNKVRYKWKLDGFDEKWSPKSDERSILYSNLNPGTYTFMVKACNEEGIWSEPVSFELTIAKPYWKKWWFLVACIGGGLLIAGAIFLLILRRSKRKGIEERRKLEMENQIMELERKALRLQMNPHFIFNAFNSIQSLVGTDKEDDARYYLAKFSRLMRSILDNSGKSLITLQEEIETLENYLMIEKFCNGNRFDYTVNFDQNLETSFISIPPMLLQPFVENAIKHGFKFDERESEKRGNLSVSFSEKDNVLTCRIRDNGIGRKRSAKLKDESKETYHISAGLSVTRERLEVLKREKGTGELIINDLQDVEGNSAGTEIILHLSID
ncbi:MAG: two-component regulator propeller domain-containing protein [Crocinitomicaceae bacterium]|nr:two-component regulator propeller domain-containing protein [Crocinitomicaceae bacterium]